MRVLVAGDHFVTNDLLTAALRDRLGPHVEPDRKSTRLNSSHSH